MTAVRLTVALLVGLLVASACGGGSSPQHSTTTRTSAASAERTRLLGELARCVAQGKGLGFVRGVVADLVAGADLVKLVQSGSPAETAYGQKPGRECRSAVSG